MCDCNLIPQFECADVPHRLTYTSEKNKTTLLENFEMHGIINYTEIKEITDSHGLKHGYIILIGERESIQ